MNAKRTVRLHIISEFAGQVTRQTVTADRYEKGSAVYLRYAETEAEMGRTTTTVKIEPGRLRIIRHGDVESELAFAPDSSLAGFYRTPQGMLKLETRTTRLQVERLEDRDRASWCYDLQAGSESVARFNVLLETERHPDEADGS